MVTFAEHNHKCRTVSDTFTQQWVVVGRPERVGGLHARNRFLHPGFCWHWTAMAEQTKERRITTDDGKKVQLQRKKKAIRCSEEGKRSKKKSEHQQGRTRVCIRVDLPRWRALKEEEDWGEIQMLLSFCMVFYMTIGTAKVYNVKYKIYSS